MIIITLAFIGVENLVTKKASAEVLPDQPYVDFSSERSTWFLRTTEEKNNVAFFDFYYPFDPSVKMKAYDPLAMYEFEHNYYFGDQGSLMINLKDLKKMYDPYFDYSISDDDLHIKHTVYEKLVVKGFGERSTTLEYKKKVWDISFSNISELDTNTGVYQYQEYLPVTGGRNSQEVSPVEINLEKSISNKPFTFSNGSVEIKDGEYYVPLAEIMGVMGKKTWENDGYLAIQDKELPDVTKTIDRLDQGVKIEPVTIADQTNIWNGGTLEKTDSSYTWADYMNDVADGERKSGWIWKSIYIPSGNYFKDENGKQITLEANRIVPYSLYIPTNYNPKDSRMTLMLHGGTGNEHTPTARLIETNIPIEQYAEEFNYILLSPNGWTQNPLWRQNQGLYSFEQSFKEALAQFPVEEERIFLTGNSLGGRGTLELASRYPDRFSAIAATAPKITQRSPEGGTMESIVGTDYDLKAIKDLPALIVQGTADTTTSFKVQIGTENKPGSIVSSVMPKLENAVYMTIEDGDHTYSYGSALKTIFDFFEGQIAPSTDIQNNKELTLYKESKQVKIGETNTNLNLSTTTLNETTMISLQDLKDIYGESMKVYPIYLYDSNLKEKPDYWTILHNGRSLNFTLDKNVYRVDMERYKEDSLVTGKEGQSDQNELKAAPTFSASPYEYNGQVYIPAEETLSALGLSVDIKEQNFFDKYQNYFFALGFVIMLIIARYITNRYKKTHSNGNKI
ncbi:alpha/beta hydrolase-fold protein [Bacillus weihaiensis]|uniref:alpha/beta hydrolase-fold protein n=1 Tax=Bacillus weihaiensis TaxID=1547283 RepID=UPI0023578507|nr:alpha/beta hydrolase-fold protein [Bacillus weihaiensis]